MKKDITQYYTIDMNPDEVKQTFANTGWEEIGDQYERSGRLKKGHVRIEWGALYHPNPTQQCNIHVSLKVRNAKGGYPRIKFGACNFEKFLQFADKLAANGPPKITKRGVKEKIRKPLPESQPFAGSDSISIQDNHIVLSNTCLSFTFIDILCIEPEKGQLLPAIKPGDEAWFHLFGHGHGRFGSFTREFITNGEIWYAVTNVHHPSLHKSIPRITRASSWRLTYADQILIKKLLKNITI